MSAYEEKLRAVEAVLDATILFYREYLTAMSDNGDARMSENPCEKGLDALTVALMDLGPLLNE